ncbi:MAG: TRAP transporter small permease subunit [Lautropia sp.]
MLAAALLVSGDVVARKLFNVTTGGADELSGYALAIASAWSFAFVTLDRMNVRVDALYRVLPVPLARTLDACSAIALGAFALLLARFGWSVVEASWTLSARSNSALSVVLWVPQLLWWLGIVMFLVACVRQSILALAGIVRRDWAAVARVAGARSVLDDAASEVRHVGAGPRARTP